MKKFCIEGCCHLDRALTEQERDDLFDALSVVKGLEYSIIKDWIMSRNNFFSRVEFVGETCEAGIKAFTIVADFNKELTNE